MGQAGCLEVLHILHNTVIVTETTHDLGDAYQKRLGPPLEELVSIATNKPNKVTPTFLAITALSSHSHTYI